jgi:pilus assembly protein CpaC
MKPITMNKKFPVSLLTGALLCLLSGGASADQGDTLGAPEARPAAKAAHVIKLRGDAATADATPLEYMPSEPLTIPAGEIRILPIKGKVLRVALGSGSLLSTTTVDDNLLLIAEQVGSTSLLVWTKHKVYSYHVQVVPKDLSEVRRKVEALTKGVDGISIQQIGSDLVLSGIVHQEALRRLESALKGTPNVIFNVREDLASEYTRSVLFRLHFIEVKRSLIEQIGINWDKSGNGPVFGSMGVASAQGVYSTAPQMDPGQSLLTPTPPFVMRGASRGGLFFGLATTLTSRLNLGLSTGDVRLLASPELTAKSGGNARLQVGGEVPIPMAGGFGATTVIFKPYGIILTIAPQIDANGIISAKISTELSQIDPAVTVSGIPGFLTRSTSTEVSLKSGETVALSGLVNSEMANAVDRVPAISRIPILGSLFRSDDFRSNKTELVVLLEPEIISAGDGLAQQLLQRGAATKKEFEDKVLELEKKAVPVVPQHAADLYGN